MAIKTTVAELRDNLAKYLGKVHFSGETIIVCKYGEVWAEIKKPVKKINKTAKIADFYGFMPNIGGSGEEIVNKIRRSTAEKERTKRLRKGSL